MSDIESSKTSSTYNPLANQSGIVRNPDGTNTRLLQVPCTTATPDDDGCSPVLTKDVPINANNNTWLRMFLPRQLLTHYSSNQKLPLIFYFHGGGFVHLSPDTCMIHDLCAKMAAQLLVMVVSVKYRLAPEHRLPAAYDDAIEALKFVKTSQEMWLREYADFSNCFVMGTSAGANIAYNAGLCAAEIIDDLEPLKIRGLILDQPFFGGLERTESELRLGGNGPYLTLSGSDHMWELSLPAGADRDHEYCNPTVGSGSDKLGRLRAQDWKILVCGVYGDHLIDKQREVVRMLEEKGVPTVVYFDEGYHGMESSNLFGQLKDFIS